MLHARALAVIQLYSDHRSDIGAVGAHLTSGYTYMTRHTKYTNLAHMHLQAHAARRKITSSHRHAIWNDRAAHGQHVRPPVSEVMLERAAVQRKQLAPVQGVRVAVLIHSLTHSFRWPLHCSERPRWRSTAASRPSSQSLRSCSSITASTSAAFVSVISSMS